MCRGVMVVGLRLTPMCGYGGVRQPYNSRWRSDLVRLFIAASLVLSFIALSACGPAPKREWPIWTGGGIYDSPDWYRGPIN